MPLAPRDAGLRVGDRATPKRCLRHTKDALSTRKNRKNRKKNIPSIKDVVNLCRGADTEVHSPRCLVTKWQGLLCHTALYRFRARLSSPVSWGPFDRSLSNLDTSITRPSSFKNTKKNRKKSKKFENLFLPSGGGGRKSEKMGY